MVTTNYDFGTYELYVTAPCTLLLGNIYCTVLLFSNITIYEQ